MRRMLGTWKVAVRTAVLVPVAGTLAGLAIACGSSRMTTSDFAISAAIVYGGVTTAAGIPMPGVVVRGMAYQGPCGSGVVRGSGSPDIVLTDGAGAYRQHLVGADVTQYCVVVSARPPSGSGLDSTSVGGFEVQFKDSHDVPYDSVRIDVKLSATH